MGRQLVQSFPTGWKSGSPMFTHFLGLTFHLLVFLHDTVGLPTQPSERVGRIYNKNSGLKRKECSLERVLSKDSPFYSSVCFHEPECETVCDEEIDDECQEDAEDCETETCTIVYEEECTNNRNQRCTLFNTFQCSADINKRCRNITENTCAEVEEEICSRVATTNTDCQELSKKCTAVECVTKSERKCQKVPEQQCSKGVDRECDVVEK